MKQSDLMKRIVRLRDEYGDPKIHKGGLYATLDRRLAVCVNDLNANKVPVGMGVPEFLLPPQPDVTGYLFAIVGKVPAFNQEVQQDSMGGKGFITDLEGICKEELRLSLAYEMKYKMVSKFPRIKKHT